MADAGTGATSTPDDPEAAAGPVVATAPVGPTGAGGPRFGRKVVALGAAAYALRVAIATVWYHDHPLVHDAPEYATIADRLVHGLRWTAPFVEGLQGVRKETAVHPPLASAWLAGARALGLDTPTGMRLWMAILGAATVVVIGHLGRAVAGDAVGLVAAGIAALHPDLWQNDLAVMSETGAQLATAVVLLLAVRYWKEPRAREAAWLGGACAVAALARSELVLLLPLLAIPLRASAGTGRRRLAHLGAAAAWLVVGLLPWVGWNVVRFDHPVLLTTGADLTLAQANCPLAYEGEGTGAWSPLCGSFVELAPGANTSDESELGRQYRELGMDHIEGNLDRVPVVAFARLGRTFGWWHPVEQLDVEQSEGRLRTSLLLGWAAYLLLLPLGALGVAEARRRRLPVAVLLAPVLVVAVAVAVSRGGVRFRAPAEVSLVVLAALGSVSLLARLRSTDPADEVDRSEGVEATDEVDGPKVAAP
jgi:4-amino-4-deoxy-L-arabinose transferase-like glycosyltransferase